MPHRAGRTDLKPAQRLALAALNAGGNGELTRGQYQQLAGVSRSQAAYDLAELVERGVVERVGGGRSTRYRLARRTQPSQRHWTNERIRTALGEFCAGRRTWPSAGDFKTAGHTDLYVAASRYGGIGFWAKELGFSRTGRAVSPQRSRRSIRPLLRPAAAGAALAAVLFGVVGAVLYPWHSTPARNAAGQQATHASSAGKAHTRTHTVAAAPKQARAPQRTTRHSSSSVPRETGSQGGLVAQRVSARIVFPPPKQQQTRPSTSSAGPAPLPAPSSGGTAAPAPLPSPQR